MAEAFIQVRSDHGHLFHAVRADADRFEGIVHFSWGRPICGKVKGRDAGSGPTLRIIRQAGGDVPFTSDEVAENPRLYCKKCAERVAFRSNQ